MWNEILKCLRPRAYTKQKRRKESGGKTFDMLIKWFITPSEERKKFSINYNVGNFSIRASQKKENPPTIFQKWIICLASPKFLSEYVRVLRTAEAREPQFAERASEILCKEIAITHLSMLKYHLSCELIANYERSDSLPTPTMVMFGVNKYSLCLGSPRTRFFPCF